MSSIKLTWGASPEIILYSYRTYVRPILEYGSLLFANSSDTLLKKIQNIEVQAIKIAYRLPAWATNTWCYDWIKFSPILERLKLLSKKFILGNQSDDLIKPLLDNLKPSMTGLHSPLYKATFFWINSSNFYT